MRYCLTILLFFISISLFAQDRLIKSADKKYKSRDYEKARILYEEALAIKPGNYYIMKKLVLSNQGMGETGAAEDWMKKMFDIGRVTTNDYYLYSQILLSNGKYKEALEWVKKYEEKKPGDKKIQPAKDQIEYIKNLVKDSSAYKINRIDINTPGSELGTCYYKDGVILSSSSIGHKKADTKLAPNNLPFLDLFFAKEVRDGVLVDPVPFAQRLKTEFNDGPVGYDPVDDILYITRFAPHKAEVKEGEDVFHLQIVKAENRDGIWIPRGNFFMNSPNFSVAHPSISADGQKLYFVSDMPGGYGGYDIYFCYKTVGKWSQPFNVGPAINSRENELFPFIASDGSLYFSSEGHNGLGGHDVYVATPEKGVFTSIRNMGYPINSTKDEIAFTLNSTSTDGYFSTNRVNDDGFYDILSLELSFVPLNITGIVKDNTTKEIIPGILVELKDATGKVIGESTSKPDGSFSCIINKIPEMLLETQGEAYNALKTKVDLQQLKPNEEIFLEVYLNKIEEASVK